MDGHIIKKPLSQNESEELSDLILNKNHLFTNKEHHDAQYLHPLNTKLNASQATCIAKEIDFIFQCSYCSDMGLPYQWYKIIMDTIGGSPMDQVKSDDAFMVGYSGTNLSKIQPGDSTEYFSSAVHLLPNKAYICDHCRVSCFDEDMNPL